ncbi:ribonuclease H-like domain-containing protein [Tanacetum coccineum]
MKSLHFNLISIHEKDEKLKRYRRIGMKAVKEKEQLQKTVDSWNNSSKNLWRLINSGMSSNDKLGLREDSIGKPSYSRFTKTNDFKGVPPPLSGDYTCTSTNRSEGSCGNTSEHSFETESESLDEPNEMSKSRLEVTNEKDVSVPKSTETVTINEKKMAREAEVKRVVNTGNGVTKPVWTNANRINHSNNFVPRSVQLNTCRPKFNSVRPNINTGRTNISSGRPKVNSGRPKVNSDRPKVNTVSPKVNSVSTTSNSMSPKRPQMDQINQRRDFSKSYSSVRRPFAKSTAQMAHTNAVMGSWGSASKTSASYDWRDTRPNFNYNSGPFFIRTEHPLKNMVDRGIFDSGCSGHMTGNKDQLEDFEEFNGGSVTFGGSKGYISGKGRIRVGNLDFDSVSFVKELGHFNLFSISQICDKQHKVLFTETECLVVSSDFKMPDENQILLKATSDESKLWHRRLGHINFKNLNKLVKGNLVRGLPSKGRFLQLLLRIKRGSGIIVMPSAVKIPEEKDASRTTSKNSKPEETLKEPQTEMKDSSTNPKIQAFRRELEEIAPKAFMEYLPHGMKVIVTKWVYRNKRDERGVVVRNKARLVAQGYTQEEEEVYVSQPPGFVDPDHPNKVIRWSKLCMDYIKLLELVQVYVDDIIFGSTNKSWCAEFEALMKSRFQMSSMGELTFFLGLQVKQNNEASLYSHRQDEEAIDVDVTPKTSHLNAVKRIFKYLKGKPNLGLWYPRESPFDLEAFSDSEAKCYRNTKADGLLEINATIDSIRTQSLRASIRDSLQLDDATGITMLPNDDLFEGQEHAAVAQSQPSSSTPQILEEAETEDTDRVSDAGELRCVGGGDGGTLSVSVDCRLPKVPREYLRNDFLHELVKKVKKLEGFMKRRNLVLTDSEEEEPEAQGRKSQDDPLDSSVQGLVTPPTTKVNTSGEEQVEEISPNTLEAAKTLSKVASLKSRSIDKGRRYKRRKETKGKKVVSSLDFQEEVDAGAEQVNTASAEQVNTASAEQVNTASAEQVNTASAEQVSTAEGVNTGSTKLSTGNEQVSTGGEQVSTGQDKGQREGKAPMISEETPKKSKEQILQEEASLAEAIRLDSLQKEEEAKQIHLDSLLAQRIAEEEELTEQQKKRKAQVQFEAQHYTNEDWDLIRAKIEANAELSKSMLGRNFLMRRFCKEDGDMKLISAEEIEFGEELQTKTPKRLKDDKDVEAKGDEPTKKSGRRKQMARKGMHTSVDENDSEDSDEVGEQEESTTGTETPINPVPVAMKTPSVATYKIIKQGEKGVYQIVREDGTDIVYINFGAMLKSISE